MSWHTCNVTPATSVDVANAVALLVSLSTLEAAVAHPVRSTLGEPFGIEPNYMQPRTVALLWVVAP